MRRRLIDPEEGVRSGPLCFSSRGFSLHAATCVEASDRARLERLCRYVIRPPLAAGRLQILDAEQVAFSLKSVWSDGTYQIVLSPDELLEKLAGAGAATAPESGALPRGAGGECGRPCADCAGSERGSGDVA